MARSRNIKPGLFKNEILGVQDPILSLLFAGLWTLADREGRLEDRPLKIRGELFAYREGLDMDALLESLHQDGFIRRYRCEGQAIIQVLTFAKHQNPHHREAASSLPEASPGPAPGLTQASPRLDSGLTQASPGLDSGQPQASPRLDSGEPQATPDPDRAESGAKPDLTPSVAEPQASPGLAPGQAQPRNGSAVLIPDSLNLIPDSQQIAPEASPSVAPPTAKSHDIWEAYRDAYRRRYQVDPVRNAKVNGQLCRVVDRLGAHDAPLVTAYFVENNQAYYVQRGHPVDCLLNDAEKLRTEWATGRRMTHTEAHQIDKSANNLGVWGRVLDQMDELP